MKLNPKLTNAETLKLLLVCALPVHFWAIISLIYDLSWYLRKRNLLYFLGVSGYSLGFAILESLVFFGFIYLLTFLFPKTWKKSSHMAVASTLALVIAFWAIVNQAYLLLTEISPAWFEWIMLRVYYRQHQLYPIFWILLLASAIFPIVLLPRWERGQNAAIALTEKLTVLVPIYLLFDLIGIGAAIYRVITYWI
ncbi:MAG: hypothetical protein JW757_03705 [Anaerolineales bacterium]|nr:hypothetical protein [Anaerolineales bacterium]